MVFGSSIATWRVERSSGKTLADGCSEPFLQTAGLSMPRTVAVSQSRPCLSNIELWLLAFVSQVFSSPQYAEGCNGFTLAACPGPSDSGISGSRTGIRNTDTALVFGSRIGITSGLYS